MPKSTISMAIFNSYVPNYQWVWPWSTHISPSLLPLATPPATPQSLRPLWVRSGSQTPPCCPQRWCLDDPWRCHRLVVSIPLKNMSSSVGMMTFPTYGKIKKDPFIYWFSCLKLRNCPVRYVNVYQGVIHLHMGNNPLGALRGFTN